MQLTKEEIYAAWSTGKETDGYTIHKMSYGQYFAEPITWQGGENDGFSNKTKWFTKTLQGKNEIYITE